MLFENREQPGPAATGVAVFVEQTFDHVATLLEQQIVGGAMIQNLG